VSLTHFSRCISPHLHCASFFEQHSIKRPIFPILISLTPFGDISRPFADIPCLKIRGQIVSTTFPFTYPRRWALSTGMKLIRWARRPGPTTETRRRKSAARQQARLREYAREQRVRELRERDIVRYLSQVRPYI
jgi:hypothetical protein